MADGLESIPDGPDNPELEAELAPEPKPTAAAAPGKRPLIRLVSHLVGGNMASMALRMAAGVLQGRLVAPATLGLFTGIGLSLRYAPFLQLGILDGLYRELPYHIGRGDRPRAEALASAAQAWALAVGSLYALVLLAVGAWNLAQGRAWMAAGWFTNAVLAVVFYYKTYYLQLTYRTAHDFSRLALVNVAESVGSLLLLALVAWLNFYGLCLRALLAGALGTALLFVWRPIRVRPAWNAAHLKHLLKIGLPIFGVGQLYAWWSVLNSTLVLKFAGIEGMGLYAMVMMANTAIEFIPAAVNQVVHPRMAERYGQAHRVGDLLRISWKPMVLTAVGLVPIVAAAWWLMPPVVRFLIPKYAAAIPAMRWGLLLPLANCFYPMAGVFQIVRRQDLYGVALGISMALYVAVQLWLIRDGVSLSAFPQAMLVGRVLFAILCTAFALGLRRRERTAQTPGGPA